MFILDTFRFSTAFYAFLTDTVFIFNYNLWSDLPTLQIKYQENGFSEYANDAHCE